MTNWGEVAPAQYAKKDGVIQNAILNSLLSVNQGVAASSFFQLRLGDLTTKPFLMALAATRT